MFRKRKPPNQDDQQTTKNTQPEVSKPFEPVPSLQEAIQAIKDNNKEKGSQALNRILQDDPNNVTAWIWLSGCYDDLSTKRHCLEAALKADPNNQTAQRGLQYLKSIDPSTQPELTSSGKSSAGTIQQSENYQNLAWICPHCGSRNLTPIILRTKVDLRCPRCSQSYYCLNGEIIWGQSFFRQTLFSAALHWTVRLRQENGSIIETAFAVQTSDFTIVAEDFIVVLLQGEKVVYIENKTSGKILIPDR